MFVDGMNILTVLFYTFSLLWGRSYESKETIFTGFFSENEHVLIVPTDLL